MDRPKLLIVDGRGGHPVEGGHVAPDVTVRSHQGFAKEYALTLALLGPRDDSSLRKLPGSCRVTYLPFFRTKWRYLLFWRDIRQRLRTALRDTDLVFARLPSYHGAHAIALAKKMRIPRVCLVVGIWEETIGDRPSFLRALYSRLARWLTLHAARQTNLVMAQGRPLTRYLAKLGIGAVTVIEGSLEKEDFVHRIETATDDGVRIVTISRLVPSKNLEALIDAIHLLKNEGIRPRLTIFGEGELAEALARRISRLDLEEEVDLRRRGASREEIRQVLSYSHVFVLPSLSEGVPWSVLEAMAAGLPIVAAPVGGLQDLLQHEQNALVMGSPSATSIAMAISNLARNESLRFALGRKSRETASSFLHDQWVTTFSDVVRDRVLRRPT